MKQLKLHQTEGIGFLNAIEKHLGGLLWHDMGLGKTLTTLIFLRTQIALLKSKGVLAPKVAVVVPKSLVSEWRTQVQEDAPDMSQYIVYIPYSQLSKAEQFAAYFDIRFLTLDESHYLKSPETARMIDFAAFLTAIANSPGAFNFGKIVCLSGTPFPNHAAEIYTTWAMLTAPDLAEAAERIVDMVRYNNWKQLFTNQNMNSWKTGGYEKQGRGAPEGSKEEEKMQHLIGPIIHLREADKCLDLPKKHMHEINLGLADDKLMADVDLSKPDNYMEELHVLAKAKTPHAIAWVKNYRVGTKDRLVVACPYVYPLKNIAAKIKGCVILLSSDSINERAEKKALFKAGKYTTMMGTYKLLSEGHNFQHARNSLYLGYPWNWTVIAQMMARTHRQGQTEHTNHYFLMSGANDSRNLARVRAKKNVVEGIQDALLAAEKPPEPHGIDFFI